MTTLQKYDAIVIGASTAAVSRLCEAGIGALKICLYQESRPTCVGYELQVERDKRNDE